MENNSSDSDPSTLTFVHKFSRNVQCCVHLDDQPPEPGAPLNLAFHWSGQPKRKYLATKETTVFDGLPKPEREKRTPPASDGKGTKPPPAEWPAPIWYGIFKQEIIEKPKPM